MDRKYWAATGCLGCISLILIAAVFVIPLVIVPAQIHAALASNGNSGPAVAQQVPTPIPLRGPGAQAPIQIEPGSNQSVLPSLYEDVNPGVVNIKVIVQQGTAIGEGAGSGFVIDDQGHIVTNNHVVDQATSVTVVFFNGTELEAQVVGTDLDSDLAVIKVDQLPAGVHPLALGDSDKVQVGDTVIAIGNPFGLGSSMTAGIVSAVGRTIASGATPFAIPHAIQTDAAINPGNSGGPLLNLQGEVVGVNAQIATGGAQAANAGVGFAIPVNIVQRVAPALIDHGSFEWAWLGVSGGPVDLAVAQANSLPKQQGAYIHAVEPNSPAGVAGLQGSTGTTTVDGVEVPVGGDVVTAVDGTTVTDFDALLIEIAAHNPGDKVALTILRDGKQQTVTVTLEARPSNSGQ